MRPIILSARCMEGVVQYIFSSPESYEALFASSGRRPSRFLYNNLTLTRCEEKPLDLLIFVISKCSHSSLRKTIRRTWANRALLRRYFPSVSLKVLFLVDLNIDLRVKIELEHQMNNDMVQVINLPEQYEYVTDREAALYTFVSHRCSQVKYLFKTDDDVFINTFLLLSSIPTFDVSFNRSQYLLMGYHFDYGLVVRHATDAVSQRYIVTEEEYSCPRYPRFLSGFGYVLSLQTCSLFVRAYQLDISPFPLSGCLFHRPIGGDDEYSSNTACCSSQLSLRSSM